jgi:hypothetical protein
MTAVFSVSYKCPTCFCSTVEQYIFSHVRRDNQNGMSVWWVWNSGHYWISYNRKKSLMNIHKQLQNVCMSVLLIKTLSLVLHKLHVLRKPQQCSVIYSNLFIQNDQWVTDRKLAIKGSGRNNINVLGCFKGYVPCSLTEHYLTVKQELCSSFLSCY